MQAEIQHQFNLYQYSLCKYTHHAKQHERFGRIYFVLATDQFFYVPFQINKRQVVEFLHRSIKDSLPAVGDDYFSTFSTTHNYQTSYVCQF